MGAPDPRDLATLAENVRSAFIALPGQLQDNPYSAGVLVEIHPEIKDLHKMISDLFFFGDMEIDKGAMRGTLKSLEEVEGSMRLLITATTDYKNCRTSAERPKIEERWIKRRIKLEENARLCAESLDVVLALTGTLGLPSVSSRSEQESADGSTFPDDTTGLEPEGWAG